MITTTVRKLAARVRRAERGATATEYALIVAFVAFAIIAGLTLFGQNLDQVYRRLANWVATL